jgi:hypothetical protein
VQPAFARKIPSVTLAGSHSIDARRFRACAAR